MKITRFVNDSQMEVEFQDEHKYKTICYNHNFKRGVIKNPYDKTAYGIGYIGEGIYKTGRDGDNYPTREYTSWKNLMRRCYSEKDKEKYPAYYGICTVCEEWHNFQVYAKWYYENYYEIGNGRMHLDKDILVKDNTLYSPKTCCFVPQRINMIFIKQPNRYNLPSAISLTVVGKYHVDHNHFRLGDYDTLEEAIQVHDKAMRENIKQVAEEYKSKIKPYIYEALLNW